MSLSTSPVVGAAVTGFTSPTYTITEDVSPAINARRFLVTGLGGTQANVETHSLSSPFFIDVTRPLQYKPLPRPNALTGQFPAIPMNEFRVKAVKGMTINGSITGATVESLGFAELRWRLPAGAELSTNDPEEIKALVSAFIGFLYQNPDAIVTLLTTGNLKV